MLLYLSLLSLVGIAATGWMSVAQGRDECENTGNEFWRSSLYYKQFLKSLSPEQRESYINSSRDVQYRSFLDWCVGDVVKQDRVC